MNNVLVSVSDVMMTDNSGVYFIVCPGCKMMHQIPTKAPTGPNWSFNGNLRKPTFLPSLVVSYELHGVKKVCHSFITDGNIQYLQDSTHVLAGYTVALPNHEVEDEY